LGPGLSGRNRFKSKRIIVKKQSKTFQFFTCKKCEGQAIPLSNHQPMKTTMKTENDFNPYLEAIGKNISRMHQLREEKETTLAAAIGLSQAAVSRIVNGRYPSLKIMTLLRIAQHYKVDLTELLPPRY
jgi:DNA-binding Xre family transcriptional regulator